MREQSTLQKKVIISDHGTKNCMNKCYLDKQKTILDYFAIWHANKNVSKKCGLFWRSTIRHLCNLKPIVV